MVWRERYSNATPPSSGSTCHPDPMTHQSLTAVIETLQPPPAASDVDQLAQLLMGAVGSGAGVSSVVPFSVAAAAEWWPTMLERADPRAGVSEKSASQVW
jgi:hypothetical protein